MGQEASVFHIHDVADAHSSNTKSHLLQEKTLVVEIETIYLKLITSKTLGIYFQLSVKFMHLWSSRVSLNSKFNCSPHQKLNFLITRVKKINSTAPSHFLQSCLSFPNSSKTLQTPSMN
jgi:hypothetical protein